MQSAEFFLLDPDNEPFARGVSRNLPAGGLGCVLLFLSLFVAAGLFVIFDAARQWVEFAVLSTAHAETEGQVVGRRIESDEGASYYVTYRFVADDRVHRIEESVTRGTFHSVDQGDSVTVRYALRNPSINTIEPGRIGGLLAITGFGLVWNGIVLFFTQTLVREVLRRRTLARKGKRIVGEVLLCSIRRDGDGDLVLELGFGFRSPQTGAWIEASDSQLRKDLVGKPLPPTGTPVHVLHSNDSQYIVL
ncbi:MAG: DUF3592 domain-containing protein [Anaerolineae bacterium]|jgi:hypothetical protein